MGPRVSQVSKDGKVADGNNIATEVNGPISYAGLVQNSDGTFSVAGDTEGRIYKAQYDDQGELAGFDVYDANQMTQQIQIESKTLMPDGTVLLGTNMEWTFGATASGSPVLRAQQQQEILESFPDYKWPAAS
jgi:hypothetical protein